MANSDLEAVIELLKETGQWDALQDELAALPGSVIRARVSPKGNLQIYAGLPDGPAIWRMMTHLVLIGCGAGASIGWGIDWVRNRLAGRAANDPFSIMVEGAFVGAIFVLVYWDTNGAWHDLSRQRKLIVGLLSTCVLLILGVTLIAIAHEAGLLRASVIGGLWAMRNSWWPRLVRRYRNNTQTDSR